MGRTGPPHWTWAYLFVTALLLPLVYSNATIDPVLPAGFLVVSLLGMVLVTVFGIGVLRSRTILSVNRAAAIPLGCLIAFILVATLSVIINGPTPDGAFELLKLATFAWLIHASARAIDGERSRLALLAKFVIVSVFLVGGFAILQYYQVALFEWMKRDTTVDSTMGHRNLLASFLVVAFPFVTYGLLEHEGRWRVASAVTMLISVFLLVVLQTRSAWIAFPGGLVFSLAVLAFVTKRARSTGDHLGTYRPRLIQMAALATAAVSLALLFYSPGARAPMRAQVGSMVQLEDASIHERLELWSRTVRMIREHPLLGVGLGNWRIVVPSYGAEGLRSDTGTLHFQRPHNDILWVTSETGLMGGLLYLAIFGSVLGVGARTMARTPSGRDRLVLALMLAGVAGYGLDSLFSFPKERMTHLVYLALLIGTLVSFDRGAGDKPAAHSVSRRWALALVAVLWMTTLIAGRVAYSRYFAEVELRRALEARVAKNWPAMAAHIDRVDRRYYDIDPSGVPVVWYRGVARFEMGDRVGALADFRSALEVHPNHEHVLSNIATCEALRGDNDAAIRNFESAIAIAPRFEEARTNLGSLLHSLGRDQEAYEVLAPATAYANSARFKECIRLVTTALGRQEP